FPWVSRGSPPPALSSRTLPMSRKIPRLRVLAPGTGSEVPLHGRRRTVNAIEFELNEDDLVAFGVVSLRASPQFAKTLKAVIGLACLFVVVMAVLLLLVGQEKWPAWLLLGLGIPSLVLVTPWLVWRRMPDLARRRI